MFTRHFPNSKSEVVYASRLMKAGELRKAIAAERDHDRKEKVKLVKGA